MGSLELNKMGIYKIAVRMSYDAVLERKLIDRAIFIKININYVIIDEQEGVLKNCYSKTPF